MRGSMLFCLVDDRKWFPLLTAQPTHFYNLYPFSLSSDTMTKQTARKPSAKKAIKAGKSTSSSEQQQLQLVLRDRNKNKKLVLQGKREEARRRAREWARREFGGKKNGTTSSFPTASAAASTSMASTRHSVIDLNDEEEEDDDDDDQFEEEEEVEEEKEANDNVQHPLFQKRVTKRTPRFLGVDESMVDDDLFYDAMEHLLNDDDDDDCSEKRRNKWRDPDEAAVAALSANVHDFHVARRRSLASRQVLQHERQYTTKTTSRQSLDPSGYSFSTFVSKPNP